MTLLSAEHISFRVETGLIRKRKKEILHDISFHVKAGETVGITGASGAGKSTLARVVMGLLREDGGSINFQGKTLTKISSKEMKKARKKMQMLFQNPASSLNPRMKIKESMEEPERVHEMNISDEEIHGMMERLQLRQELMERYPYQLSGGELQRVCLGRLLLLKPKLLILDEPTSMLDVSVQAQIIGILKERQREENISYLFISHDLGLLKACCHRIGILKQGKLVEMSDTETLFQKTKDRYTKELISAFWEV